MTEPRRRRTAHVATVVRTEKLSASMVRVVLDAPTLVPVEHADAYVKAVFVDASVPRPFPRTDDGRVAVDDLATAPEQRPRMRSYTVRATPGDEVVLDVVVHGDEGLAGPWAAGAAPGDELLLLGPNGAYAPDPDASFHLLAGDLSALPAIANALEAMPGDAVGAAYVEVHGPEDEVALTSPAGVAVTYLHHGDGPPGPALVEAVRALPWPGEGVSAFVHGEAGAVRQLRHYLRVERGMGLDALSVSGYWRLGDTDEGWRAGKREWNAEIERDEAGSTP